MRFHAHNRPASDFSARALCSARAGGAVERATARNRDALRPDALQNSTVANAVNGAQREQSCRSTSDEASTHTLTAREAVLAPGASLIIAF